LAEAGSRHEDVAVLIAGALENDLEGAAFSLMPELAPRKEALRAAGAVGALMSGSGPTMFGVCRSPEHAEEVCARLIGWGLRAQTVTTAW
jgi:4-diphosphocytidyl-2-C-methyl-D-erythritol kinase